MSAAPIRRQPATAERRFRVGRTCASPVAREALETNATDSSAAAPANAPNCRSTNVGSAKPVVAFGSPTTPQAGKPAFRTSSGLTAKCAGDHSTMSASRPGVSAPTSCDSPCASAGLMVHFAR